MNKEDLAQHLRVTRQTLKNWETTKPELLQLIHLGLSSDNRYKVFFNLFNNGFWDMNNFYLDFYFKFLNYFRQNVTLPSLKRLHNTDLTSTFFLYMMEKEHKQLFDNTVHNSKKDKTSEINLAKFIRDDFKTPICNVDSDLSIYILKNCLDDFKILLEDTLVKDDNNELFLDALRISIMYLIYKFEGDLSWDEKNELKMDILSNLLETSPLHMDLKDINKNKVFQNYLRFRNKYTQSHIDKISNELPLYLNNNLYNPSFLPKLL